jgi:hypothetical protein
MRLLSVFFLISFASIGSHVLSQTRAIDVNAAYRLTNGHAGPGKSLAVFEGSVVMSDNSDTPDQLWKFVLGSGGKYRLINVGEGRAKSLDTRKSGDQFSIVMGETGDYSGQSWTATPLGGGKFRFTNEYAGKEKSLDTKKSGEKFSVVMGETGNFSGQAWVLVNETDDAQVRDPAINQNSARSVALSATHVKK